MEGTSLFEKLSDSNSLTNSMSKDGDSDPDLEIQQNTSGEDDAIMHD
jgi:hypothetical protein